MSIIFTYIMRFTKDSKVIVLSAMREEVDLLVLLKPSQTEGFCLCMLFFFSFTTAMRRRFFDKMAYC